jgi:peptidase M28-like protein/PDZ domain-containing protein
MELSEVEKEIDRNLTPLSQPLAGWTCELQTNVSRETIPVKNVIGCVEGSGPLAKEIVVLGAHYDHLGYGGAGSLAPGSRAIHHGADDNASGTTTVVELARRFGAMKDRQGRKLVFMTFSGEESGLLGSAHYCKKPIFPLEQTVAMVNMDMVGRLRDEKITIGGSGTAKTFDALLDEINKKHKFDMQKDKTGYGPSDHQSFYAKKIPVFFFYTGMHQQYHKPTDTVDTINVPGMRRVADFVEDLTTVLATDKNRPEYQYVAGSFNPGQIGSPGRTGPRLGVVPSYVSDDKPGLVLDGVTDGGPAKKAGLQGGDRIVEISGKPVKDISAYMTIMAGFKKGDTLQVVVERKGEKKTIPVLLE